ncbi:uncharacterized protein PHALS_08130 [Plasmopara halstedii]|uniref:Uncharacterized protein n=1 Tax=Plasmopara halstedii TaxID=4781 RepID=A0A0P1B8D2_PLAHL|nr:uncharacterized protein PHALS_08130 [Plasmopara halstedii]CEG50418.1 hypothetical protein PHALS_08130 [Plasmopara halstedii]|eukprot:XP_024586787.1 hypothetical protein PHALS_08130 [Plasmopara halstedii]
MATEEVACFIEQVIYRFGRKLVVLSPTFDHDLYDGVTLPHFHAGGYEARLVALGSDKQTFLFHPAIFYGLGLGTKTQDSEGPHN